MLTDELYELCLTVLQDKNIDDEEKTEKLEEILRKEKDFSRKALENAVLDALWRFRTSKDKDSSPPPARHNIIRKASPAPWQIARTPTPSQNSPRVPPPGLAASSPAFARTKSSTASPFTSPRASPRLALSTPHIPHSPRLDAYQFSDPSPTLENYGDLGSDAIDSLVNDDTQSNASSFIADPANPQDWAPGQSMDIYDILRTVCPHDKPNEELEQLLQENGYDLSATINALMGAQGLDPSQPAFAAPEQPTLLVGKSMIPTFRPTTPLGQQKSHIVCKYWLQSGNCARADCRFSHDPSKVVCKYEQRPSSLRTVHFADTPCRYWMQGNCYAGDNCLFSHDPSTLFSRMMIDDSSAAAMQQLPPNFQIQDYEAFPSLQGVNFDQGYPIQGLPNGHLTPLEAFYGTSGAVAPPPGFNSSNLNPLASFTPSSSSRPPSRPSSRHGSRAPTPSIPAVDDNEAFPTLGSAAAVKGGKKHHGKRGHGHHAKEAPNSLAELVRMSPSPSPAQVRRGAFPHRNRVASRENSAAAQSIPAPEHIPWLETGEAANKVYLKHRAEAFKHGGLRNKFLQQAAQAYNRHDSRAAKALSLRGQAENNLMREAHRKAAEILYTERNKHATSSSRELYIDLHGTFHLSQAVLTQFTHISHVPGLHPDEAIDYLRTILSAHETEHPPRPVYAITGTGHHSKNGRDKIGKAVRGFLNEMRYAFREFSVPGDRGNMGGIIGIDPSSAERGVSVERDREDGAAGGGVMDEVKPGESTKIRIMKREDVDSLSGDGN